MLDLKFFYFWWYGNKANEHRSFQTKLQEKEYQLNMFMILNEEMTKAQDFFAPAATNKGMITTFSNRTNIFVKWKTDNGKLRIKTEVRSKFKIILTTVDKKNSIEKWVSVA